MNAAAFSTVQSAAAGTPKPEFPILSFDGSTDEGRIWSARVPRGYGGTLVLAGMCYSTGTTGSGVFVGQIAANSDGDVVGTAKAYAAANAGTFTIPTTAYNWKAFNITLSTADSIAAGDWCNIAVWRNGSGAGDTVNGIDINVTLLDAYFTLAA